MKPAVAGMDYKKQGKSQGPIDYVGYSRQVQLIAVGLIVCPQT